MDDRTANRIEDKIDSIMEQISEINSTLAAQHVSLEIHIKRTNILEEKILPIEERNSQLNGIIKLGGLIVGALTVAAALAEILGFFKHG